MLGAFGRWSVDSQAGLHYRGVVAEMTLARLMINSSCFSRKHIASACRKLKLDTSPDCRNFDRVPEDPQYVFNYCPGRKKEPWRNSRIDTGTGKFGAEKASISEGLGLDQRHDRIYPEQTTKDRGDQESAITNATYRGKEIKLERTNAIPCNTL